MKYLIVKSLSFTLRSTFFWWQKLLYQCITYVLVSSWRRFFFYFFFYFNFFLFFLFYSIRYKLFVFHFLNSIIWLHDKALNGSIPLTLFTAQYVVRFRFTYIHYIPSYIYHYIHPSIRNYINLCIYLHVTIHAYSSMYYAALTFTYVLSFCFHCSIKWQEYYFSFSEKNYTASMFVYVGR